MRQILQLFARPNRSDSVREHLETDYDLLEAQRRLLDQGTALKILESERGERRTA